MIAAVAPLEALAGRRGRLTVVGTIAVLVALVLGTTPAVSLPAEQIPGLVVFGLAARRDADRPTDIERLTDELRGFVSRLEDADPTADDGSLPAEPDLAECGRDRDDEIGRLSAAVDDLATAVRDRERQRAESERYRREIARITSESGLGTETKIRRLLELGCERLGLETGLVSHVDEPADRYEIEAAVGAEADLEGAVLDLSETHCRNTVTSDDVVGISETPAADVDVGAAVESVVGCYIGGKIRVDGDLYGTVCFVSDDPRDRPFSPAERSFVDLLARWVSGAFERREYVAAIEERERRLERTQAFTDDMLDAVDDVVYLLEEDGDLRRWNETLVDVTGYSDAEIAEMNALDFFDAENEGPIRESMQEAFETGETLVEAELRTKSGERIPYEFIASVLEDPNGNPVEVGIGRDISDRKERERRLERTTSLLEQSQRLADVGAWELDVSTEPYDLQWTAEIRRILGVSPDEPIDLESAFEFYHPEDRPRIREAVERAITDGEPYDIELRMWTADGDRRWVRTIGEPVREDGEIVTLRGSFQDVTERKERERDLERAETVLQALDELVYTIDADGEFTYLNDALEGITGYEPDDLIGDHVSTMMDDDDLETARDRIRDLRSAGEPTRTFEMDLETADGDVIDVENHMALLPSDDGEFAGTAGVLRDITDRKERERDLERFEAIVQALDELVYTLDEEGRFTYLNDAAKPILGYEPEELIGKPAATVIPAADVERAQDRIRELLRSDVPSQTVEIVLETADDEVIDVENHIALLPSDDGEFVGSAGVVRDITARKERERDLERTTELLKQAERLAGIGGWELDLSGETRDVTFTDGLHRLYDLPLDATVDSELATSFPHPEDRERVLEIVDRTIEAGEGYDIEHRMRTMTGDKRWVRSTGEPIRADGADDAGIVGVRGTIQDITDRKERELTLESLHDAARDLLGTDTEAEVSALVVETAADILEASGAAVYRLDPAVNRLVPAASTEAFDRLCNGAPSVAIGDGESALWSTYVTGTGTVVDDPSSVDRSQVFGPAVESGVIVPIGDYGVFTVATDAEPIDAEARRLIETLVATTEAAFDRLESEASLREREAQLEARNERLNRQIETTELIRRIDQVLIGAESRGEIERTVPERLLEADSVAFAWIGDRDPSGTRLEPRAWAGDGEAYLDDVSLADDAAEPAVRTAIDGTPTVVSNVVEGLQGDPWRRRAVDRGFQSVISVPLSHAEYSYGVLTIYADEPDAFGDLERTVLTELGEGIANSITAMKTREALHAERLLELTLRIAGDEDPLSRLAAKTGADVEYAGMGSHSSDETLLFVETDGVAPDDVRSALAELVSVTDSRLISEADGTCRFEATVSGDPLAARLVRHGGSPRSIRADGEGLEVVVDVPTGTDVREFVETLGEGHGGVELRARRHVERSMGTRSELVTSLFDALTDRQLEVLRTAYFAGFFEWPRESTGEEIAEMLAVTQPTVNRHLRLAQGRLLAQLFEDQIPLDSN
ncbi:PAS domain S-box protein [Natrinema thermotolerans]